MIELHNHKTSSLRFIVLQMGAMRHYLVPATLARAGMLEHLYTDICGNIGLTTPVISHLLPTSLQSKPIKRLLGRILPNDITASSVTTLPINTIYSYIANWLQNKGILIPHPIPIEEQLRQRILADEFLNANAIYTWRNSDLYLAIRAKQKGLFVVHDQYLNPDVGYILHEEKKMFPNLEKNTYLSKVKHGINKDKEKWKVSDLILAPSPFVRDSIIKMGGDSSRTVVVPFGLNKDWRNSIPNPQQGRVLFVGSVGLRKGNHYLAQATQILNQRRVPCEVRVVGPYNLKMIQNPQFQGPVYVGQIPRSQIKQEFLNADIFVLPTLSDSFALVQLEAISCGLPVITTSNCGSVIRDGIEGFIIPIRDAKILADRIEELVTSRELREQMSINAKQRSREFTWEKYSENLLKAFQKLS